MDFETQEALQNFAGDEELTKIRAASGAKLELSLIHI